MNELRASYESEQKSKAKLEEDLSKLRQQYEKGMLLKFQHSHLNSSRCGRRSRQKSRATIGRG
jgi:hypothetical protein